ncbi:TonB-dependent receptor plug domain-containing protein [Bdellovibrio bacteriovorus]|uniref:TonB-dependent receptor plug domain-containing protein n=1 Tax=Bdellovibrio TaxID=958 RepID=UPI0035A96393
MKHFYFVLSLLASAPAWAQETPPSFETVVEDVVFNTSSRVVIDEKTIKESRAPNITSLLASQANVTVTNTPFQPNSIYIRGGDSSHLLILIDGVPFYDASTIQRTFNLNSLDVKSVRRIEIIKGSQTVLYGGQALSGVIKIETIPQDLQNKTGLQGEIGTQNARDISATHTEMLTDNSAMIVRGHGSWKDAESPVLNSSQTYSRNNWNAEGAYAWKGAVEGHVKANYIQELNFSATSGMSYQIVDTSDFEQYARQLGLSSNLKFNEYAWSPRLTLSAQNSLRTFNQPVTAENPFLTDQDYGANLRTVRLDLTPYKNDRFTLTTGLSYIFEDFVYRDTGAEKSNSFSEQRGVFAKADYKVVDNVEISAGGRVENWADQDPVSTYQVGLTLFEKTKLEVSTGYKIPSLFQLYSTYGNPDLKEERATQYSLSQEIQLSERQQLSITLFASQFSNLIVTQGSFPSLKYTNVNKSETRGAEVVYTLRPTETSSLLMTYGYQEPRDVDNARWLIRRPLVNGSIKYIQTWGPQTGSLEVVGAGERLDRNSNTTLTTLPGYAIANASYSYEIGNGLTAYTRLNNLLDYRYQETYSFYTEGFSGVIGGEYWF